MVVEFAAGRLAFYMAEIRPFRGLRFSAEAGPIHDLVAPPYDVINQAERENLVLRNARNIVHLTLPEQKDDDRSKFVKYARSAATLSEWRRDGILALEAKPAFYRYTQTFTIPYLSKEPMRRTSIIALIKIEPYEKGIVLPHEQTFPKHKEDRLRILEATRAHLECIFGLFEDPDGAVHRSLVEAPAGSPVEVRSDDHVEQRLEPITDSGVCANLEQLLAEKMVWIADGHHRYETAVAFRAALGERPGPVPEDYMMMALASMSDPGLVLLPTHRVLKTLPCSTDDMLQSLGSYFEMEEMHSSNLFEKLRKVEAVGGRAFGVSLRGGDGYLLIPKDFDRLLEIEVGEGSKLLRGLDVSILHSVIFEKICGVQGLESIIYTRDHHEAVRLVEEGAAAAFLMNPPTVDDMRTIALGGEKMPQKSTYYFPKILSGLVLWSLNDF